MDDKEYWSKVTSETRIISDCKLETIYKDPYGETETFTFIYDKITYQLYLFKKILFRVPSGLGKWLFSKGCAIENYEGVRRADD